MTIRRKSRWRSENLRRHLRNRANQRAAKERIRRARLALPPCAGRSPLRRACVLALLRAKGVGV